MSKITEIVDDVIAKTNTNTTEIGAIKTGKLDTAIIHSATPKTIPADNDEFAILDSADTFSLKKLTWANLKATLLSYFSMGYTFSSLANGYIKFPDWLGGFIIQWVTSYSTVNAGGNIIVTLPLTFPSSMFTAVSTARSGQASNAGLISSTNNQSNQVTIYNNGTATLAGAFIIAVGK